MDLFSIDNVVIDSSEVKLIHTGICIELPKQTEAQVRPRSGLAIKNGITVLNSPGTIDEGYRGEIGVILINHDNEPFNVTIGMRIAQLVVKPTYEVELVESHALDDSVRGKDGYGSTGQN